MEFSISSSFHSHTVPRSFVFSLFSSCRCRLPSETGWDKWCTRAATSISAARRGTVTMARTATPCPRYRHGKHTGQANQLFSIRTYCFNFGYYPIKINYPRHKIWEKPELVLADHYIGTHLFPPFFFTCHVLCQTLLSLAIHIEIFIVLKPIWIIYYGSVFY